MSTTDLSPEEIAALRELEADSADGVVARLMNNRDDEARIKLTVGLNVVTRLTRERDEARAEAAQAVVRAREVLAAARRLPLSGVTEGPEITMFLSTLSLLVEEAEEGDGAGAFLRRAADLESEVAAMRAALVELGNHPDDCRYVVMHERAHTAQGHRPGYDDCDCGYHAALATDAGRAFAERMTKLEAEAAALRAALEATPPHNCFLRGDCCNPECGGQWGTGCHCCHHGKYHPALAADAGRQFLARLQAAETLAEWADHRDDCRHRPGPGGKPCSCGFRELRDAFDGRWRRG